LAAKDDAARAEFTIKDLEVAMEIDRQRIAAVRKLNELGFTYLGGEWVPPVVVGAPPPQIPTAEADAMHAALVHRADGLAGCTEGSEAGVELNAIAEVLEAYEAKRWPDGKEPGGKG
jgi:hypothetical protein